MGHCDLSSALIRCMSPVSNAMEHLAPKKLAMLLILVWYGAHVLSAPSKHGHHMDLADDIEEVSSNKHHIITDLPEDGAPEITDNDVFEGDIMGVDKEAFGSDPEGQVKLWCTISLEN